MSFVALPDDLKVGITALVLWAISWAFVQLITLVPFLKFLDDFKQPLALAISAALIGAFEDAVPDQYGNVAIIGVQLVLAIIAMFQVNKTLGARGYRMFK